MNRASRAALVVSALIASLSVASLVRADVALPRILDSNMVLQCDRPLPIWGWAAPGEEVTVSIAGQKVTAKADQQGHWQVKLAPLAAGSNPLEMKVAGKNIIELKNILVGEVWVCSGQSNMGMSVSQVTDAEKELAAADHPTIPPV